VCRLHNYGNGEIVGHGGSRLLDFKRLRRPVKNEIQSLSEGILHALGERGEPKHTYALDPFLGVQVGRIFVAAVCVLVVWYTIVTVTKTEKNK
jgi:hypothetical protein